MAKQGVKAVVPRLRFPEFHNDGSWETVRIGALVTVRNDKRHPSDELPLFSLTIEDGVTAKSDRYNREFLVRDKKAKLYKLVLPGDIVYNPSNLRWGAINRSNVDHPVVVSPIYEVLYPSDAEAVDQFFISTALMRPQQIARLITKGQGTLVERIAVKVEDFVDTSIEIPHSFTEQQKIADCLTSLDEVIAAQGRKVEALKSHKRGLMQQLFPREGETRPRLRFPEFRDAPEWEALSLCQLAVFQSGSTPSKANPNFWNGAIPWVSAKDMKMLLLDDTEDHISLAAADDGARLVPPSTLLMLTRGMTLLKDVPICIVRREMSFNQDVKALRLRSEVDGIFLAYLLLASKSRLLAMVDIAGHGTGKLDTDELKSFKTTLPRLVEQQRIADCLSSLDTQITAESNRLASLKTHKQGLMQQLFPSLEAVGA